MACEFGLFQFPDGAISCRVSTPWILFLFSGERYFITNLVAIPRLFDFSHIYVHCGDSSFLMRIPFLALLYSNLLTALSLFEAQCSVGVDEMVFPICTMYPVFYRPDCCSWSSMGNFLGRCTFSELTLPTRTHTRPCSLCILCALIPFDCWLIAMWGYSPPSSFL